MDDLLVPHGVRTIERAHAARVAFAVTDTTSYTFPGDAERDGLGPVNESDQGFLAHVTLLISADRASGPARRAGRIVGHRGAAAPPPALHASLALSEGDDARSRARA